MNDKKYKLIKDLPGVPAGTISTFVSQKLSKGSNKCYFEFKSGDNTYNFTIVDINAHADFFEEIPNEPEAPKSWEHMHDKDKKGFIELSKDILQIGEGYMTLNEILQLQWEWIEFKKKEWKKEAILDLVKEFNDYDHPLEFDTDYVQDCLLKKLNE